MGKIYEGVWGYIFRLNYIGNGDGSGIRREGWFNAYLIYGGNKGVADR